MLCCGNVTTDPSRQRTHKRSQNTKNHFNQIAVKLGWIFVRFTGKIGQGSKSNFTNSKNIYTGHGS